jgi:hypothetical protein
MFMNFQGKKIIILGERDGIQSPAIARCLENLGGEIVHLVTECFV